MSKLLLHPQADTGMIHSVTPQSAGWAHVGFDLWRLTPGMVAAGDVAGGREAILVVVEGHGRLQAAGQDWGMVGDRLSVFERSAPHCLYLPQGKGWRFEAETGAELAICTAPGSGRYPPARPVCRSEPGHQPCTGMWPRRRGHREGATGRRFPQRGTGCSGRYRGWRTSGYRSPERFPAPASSASWGCPDSRP